MAMSPTRNSFSGLKFSIEASVVVVTANGARRRPGRGRPRCRRRRLAGRRMARRSRATSPASRQLTTASSHRPDDAPPPAAAARASAHARSRPMPPPGRPIGRPGGRASRSPPLVYAIDQPNRWPSRSAPSRAPSAARSTSPLGQHGPVYSPRPRPGHPSGSPTGALAPNAARTPSRPSAGPWSWAPPGWRATPGSPPTGRSCSTTTAVTGPPWRRRPIAGPAPGGPPGAIFRPWSSCTTSVGSDFELSLDVKDPAALEPILAAADRRRGAGPAVAVPRRPRACWPAGGRSPARPGWSYSTASAGSRRSGFWTPAAAACGMPASMPSTSIAASGARRGSRRSTAPACWAFGWDAQTRRGNQPRCSTAGVDGVYSDHVDVLMAAIGDGPAADGRPAGPTRPEASEKTEAGQRPDPERRRGP